MLPFDWMQPFFEWMGSTAFATFFLTQTWSSPIIQCAHLIAIVIFSGAVLVVDVRLLGRGLTSISVAELARQADKWMIWSFVALLATGVPQMMSTALKQYYSPFFWWKMQLILLGLVFSFTIRRKVAMAEEARIGPAWPKLVGTASILIWTSVAIWARLIGLLS